MSEFHDKRILITGAGKGIGRATALHFAELGAKVIAISRDPRDLESLAEEIGCETFAVDLADADATRRAASAAQPVDFLVNCAGTTTLESFLDTSVENFDHLMAVNVRAAMIVAQETARNMIARQHRGAIVNVSSISSWVGFQDHASYCATKGALDALTRVMANELGRHGIRVNAVNPVVTLTPMAVKAWSDPAKSEPMLSRIPLGRFVEPNEVATAIAYLLGSGAAMVNGITMPIDGGFMVN
ncbi:SDR family oxidoreductase [Kaistia dalseonensis]|uniref:NAD(P)-dependent dehydrogenase (Short-subunit alcohol dehydrogenase family) n=1 Tax=Kaistia dalseonensis TaxID=410840 RepID=A0ABU0HCT5_9HYPH|nr:SDR family oxidoreductase [Kaistia dalseonensis]MCX5497037.1 SDR family oxidoreductase [Kaistia dalseonensis]MDQ0439663.1 NAD(P)-dependent dehydrogenase (short-subunit alcohol dehydrogenase family) [Kaistia dalseonensis]